MLTFPLSKNNDWNTTISTTVVALASDAWHNRRHLLAGVKENRLGTKRVLLSYRFSLDDLGCCDEDGDSRSENLFLHLVLSNNRWWWTIDQRGPWDIPHESLDPQPSIFDHHEEDPSHRQICRTNHCAFHDLLDDVLRDAITEMSADMSNPGRLHLHSTMPVEDYSPRTQQHHHALGFLRETQGHDAVRTRTTQ